jgi:type II secretion system protein N
MKIDWTVWKPRALYGAFFAVAFLLALRWTFPGEALKERLILEASARGWQLDAGDVSGAGLLGVAMKDVRLEDHEGHKYAASDVAASLRVLPLLVGKRSVAFDVRLWDGRVRGAADLSGADRRYAARVEGVDLASAAPLRAASGLELLGTVTGDLDVVVPEDAAAKASGRASLAVKDAGVNGGQLSVAAMGGNLSVPKVALGDVGADVTIANGRGNVTRLETRGGDAEISTEGLYFVMQPRLEYAPLFGKARLRIADAFWTRSGTAGFRTVAEMALASAKGRDGNYHFQLVGTLGHPEMRVLPGQ